MIGLVPEFVRGGVHAPAALADRAGQFVVFDELDALGASIHHADAGAATGVDGGVQCAAADVALGDALVRIAGSVVEPERGHLVCFPHEDGGGLERGDLVCPAALALDAAAEAGQGTVHDVAADKHFTLQPEGFLGTALLHVVLRADQDLGVLVVGVQLSGLGHVGLRLDDLTNEDGVHADRRLPEIPLLGHRTNEPGVHAHAPTGSGQVLRVVGRIHHGREKDLLLVVQIDGQLRAFLGLAQGGKQHAREDRDDGDDDKQFDEGETALEESSMDGFHKSGWTGGTGCMDT